MTSSSSSAAFEKLLMNFTWWVNRKDRFGNNVFEGGFLGLDNIGVFDRSAPLPTGGHLEQADGTAWMVFFSQQMLRIAVELALHEPLYEEFVVQVRRALRCGLRGPWTASAAQGEMWDEEDGFFYDVLRLPDGSAIRLKVRSMVGLLPLAAVAIFEEDILERLPSVRTYAGKFMARHPELATYIRPADTGVGGRRMLSTVNEDKLRRILTHAGRERVLRSPRHSCASRGIHLDHPFVFRQGGQEFGCPICRPTRTAACSAATPTGGARSGCRSTSCCTSALLRACRRTTATLHRGVPDRFGQQMTSSRWRTILPAADRDVRPRRAGRRPVFGGTEKFQRDPHWRDYILFYEYFHGDNGAGIGASHQTGWTGWIARIIQANGYRPATILETIPNSRSTS